MFETCFLTLLNLRFASRHSGHHGSKRFVEIDGGVAREVHRLLSEKNPRPDDKAPGQE
jgi:hypothetical protein